MLPRLFWGMVAAGAAYLLFNEKKSEPENISTAVKIPPVPSDKPTKAEMRKVMRHLGKRSGQVRSR